MDYRYPSMGEPSGGAAVTLLLRPREAAKSLSLSERTLFSLVQRGQLRAVRIGRAVRYDLADLCAFIERQKGRDHV